MQKAESNYQKVRSILSNHIEDLLEFLNSKKSEAKSDSVDIFSSFSEADETDSSINWHLNRVKIKSKLEVLKEEKNALGVYMSGNPLEDYLKLIDIFRKVTKMDKNLHLVVVNKVKKVFTRANAMMFALQMTTTEGDIEGVIFSKKALEYSNILEDNKLYWIIGNIDDKSESTSANKEKPQEIKNPELATEEEGESMVVEYVEKPKLLISHIVKFETGFLELLKTYEHSPASEEFINSFPTINWLNVENDPKILEFLYPKIEKLDGLYEFKERKKRAFNPNSNYKFVKKPEPEIESKPKKLKVTLNKSLGEKIAEIKKTLLKEPKDGYLPIELWIEIEAGEVKKVKGDFWMPKDLIQKG
jgi:DNA polymerase III alpha subunit